MYGQRVCIPRKFQNNILEELHAGHLGIVKMKAIARSFVCWKNIHKDIEEAAKNCVDCVRYKADPTKAKVHYWEYPSMPWEFPCRFCWSNFEHAFFLIVNAHSKWVLVSDNGSQFTFYEFQRFMQRNGIKHKTSAPFKPSSNGQAERYVVTLKQSLRAMHKYTKDKLRDRKIDVGDRVAVRVYRAANTRWKFGTIVNQDGVLHYIIDVQGTLMRRHVDQIRPVGDQVQENIIQIIHQRFPSAEVQENNPNIQHAETAEDVSKDLNKELGSSSVQEVPSTDVAVPDVSQSSAKETDSETRSPPVPEKPFPRHSGRIRRPRERLVL
ncbi:transposon Tf2-9 polyprotein [Trichonephila clavata]|uniref:RNA-directed DNA polymerase n=1 Tax=Trichonephila clavata TaxID=2740835 RepID=A0A8X6K534_TRICU|nr:transposon Tf2-9 polyprotein [Trichonephila clavata]